MSQGSRPDRVADQLRSEIAELLTREVHDPGVGFVTLTRVQVSGDLQTAKVLYTRLGSEAERRATARALHRVVPFLRRRIGARLRLKRVPELSFYYDESIAGQDRIEQILSELHDAGGQPGSGRSDADGPSEVESADNADVTSKRQP